MKQSSSSRCTIWRCWSRRRGPWTRPHRWWAGSCLTASSRRLLEAKLGKSGSREYIQVLRLLETFALQQVTGAVEDALRLGTVGFDAVKHLLLCRIERRPPRLDMENWPHLPLAQVRTTQAADYMVLLPGSPTGTSHSNAEVTL